MRQIKSADVIGIGACTIDHLFVVDQLPKFGEIVCSSTYDRQLGGAVATALVALAQFGISTQLISKIGSDYEGDFIITEFQRKNVDISNLAIEKNGVSRVILVLIDRASGERCFTWRPENLKPLELTHSNQIAIQSAKILHLNESNETTMQAAKWAKNANVTIVFDGGWLSESVNELLQMVDIPIVSEEFGKQWIPNATANKVIEELFNLNKSIAVVTLGAKGCIVKSEKGTFAFPAFPIKAIDTTGAGDAFRAGFIYGLLQNWEIEQIICFSSAVAAINCLTIGGQAGLPTVDMVERFLRNSSFPFNSVTLNQ